MEISNQKASKIFSTSANPKVIREAKQIGGIIVNYKVVLPKKHNKYKTHLSMLTVYNRQQVKRKKH